MSIPRYLFVAVARRCSVANALLSLILSVTKSCVALAGACKLLKIGEVASDARGCWGGGYFRDANLEGASNILVRILI